MREKLWAAKVIVVRWCCLWWSGSFPCNHDPSNAQHARVLVEFRPHKCLCQVIGIRPWSLNPFEVDARWPRAQFGLEFILSILKSDADDSFAVDVFAKWICAIRRYESVAMKSDCLRKLSQTICNLDKSSKWRPVDNSVLATQFLACKPEIRFE